nr:uncharacterized protein LOC112015144 isoform X3 [Quercus suber]
MSSTHLLRLLGQSDTITPKMCSGIIASFLNREKRDLIKSCLMRFFCPVYGAIFLSDRFSCPVYGAIFLGDRVFFFLDLLELGKHSLQGHWQRKVVARCFCFWCRVYRY